MALEKKYIVFLAKMECADKNKKKRSLASINDLSIEELNEIWPGWTPKDIADSFLDIYTHILKAETKGVKREKARLYTHSLLTKSWMTKQLTAWVSDGTFSDTEKERLEKPLFDVNMAW